MSIPLPLEVLEARKVELVSDIQEYIATLRQVQNILTHPDVDRIEPDVIDYYVELALSLNSKIRQATLELVDVLSEIDRHLWQELDVGLIQWVADILLELDSILASIESVVAQSADPVVEPDILPEVEINTVVNVEIDIALGDAEEFWDVVGKGFSSAVKAPFEFLTELMSEMTVQAMGVMFALIADYAGSKMGGFIDNAVGGE